MASTVNWHPRFKEGFSALPPPPTSFQVSNGEGGKWPPNEGLTTDTPADIVNVAFLSVIQFLVPRGEYFSRGRRINVGKFQVGFNTA